MEEAIQSILDALINGVSVIAVLAIGAIVTGVRAWILAKADQLTVDKSATEVALLHSVVNAVIKFIDQKELSLDNAEKAIKALQVTKNIVTKRAPKLAIDDEELETIIEASLNDLRINNDTSSNELASVIGFSAVPSTIEEYWEDDDEDFTEDETGTEQA